MDIIIYKNKEIKLEVINEKNIKKYKKIVWFDKEHFLYKLNKIQHFADIILGEECYDKSDGKQLCYDKNYNCKLCSFKYKEKFYYKLKNIAWDRYLTHYIDTHNYIPSDYFINFIFTYYTFDKKTIIFNNKTKIIKDIPFVKIDRNQLLILDALMKHGGYTKKYSDKSKNNKFIDYKWSEHIGMLDVDNHILKKIIVKTNTNRVDRGDEEIYQPIGNDELNKYEYIYHTHPPTPKPGGRSKDGILYEFPSLSDILVFIEEFNSGNTCGSIVITPEGLYNIRSKDLNNNKIILSDDDEDDLRKNFNYITNYIQRKNIKSYGYNINNYTFYSKISQNLDPINQINRVLEKYGLFIDYYPRQKNNKGQWIIDTIYLPLYKNIGHK